MSVIGRVWSYLGIAVIALSLTCGGDDPVFATGTLAGNVLFAGGAPVVGANVTVWMVDDDGTRREEPFGTGETDADGSFYLEIGVARNNLLIEAAGGSTREVSTAETVNLDPDQLLRAVLTGVAADSDLVGVVVSPLTTMAVALGTRRHDRGDESTYGAALERANQLLGDHVGADLALTPPIDVTDEASAGTTLTPNARHGLALAGMSELAHQIAQASRLSANAINTMTLAEAWSADLASDEALFDGASSSGALVIGTCEACTDDTCSSLCELDANSPRSKLARAMRALVGSSANATGLEDADIRELVEGIAANDEVELFGDAAPESLDVVAPVITWVTPQSGNVLSGPWAVDVTAEDLGDITSLTVEIVGGAVLVDEDEDPERFYVAELDTTALPEGELSFRATVVDADLNRDESTVDVTVNNLGQGIASGVVVKGEVFGAQVTAYGFAGGERGAELGTATTDGDGLYQLTMQEGYSGPVLVVAGGSGTYLEEALPVSVGLDLDDELRTILFYTDGTNPNDIVVTPLTSLAVAYTEYLIAGTTPDEAALSAAWTAAVAVMQSHFNVANITTLRPAELGPSPLFSAAVKYRLVLAGLSQMAYEHSEAVGSDGGAFGSVISAVSVWRKLEADLADGCFDGTASGEQLYFGSTELSSTTPRIDLANAIVGFLTGPENPTHLTGPSHVLTLLDTLSNSGPDEASATCEGGEIFAGPGELYDQNDPTIVWDEAVTKPAGALVRGSIDLRAVADDDLAPAPVARFKAPEALVGVDTDVDPSAVAASIDTESLDDGDITVIAEAEDDSTNTAEISRTFTIDNTPPIISVDEIENGGWYKDDQVISFWQSDTHPGTTSATLDSIAITSPHTVSTEGSHNLEVTASDAAGNSATPVDWTFYIDKTAPVLELQSASPSGAWVRGTLTLTVIATDNLQDHGSLGSDIVVSASGPGGDISPTSVTASPLGDARQVVVAFNTVAIGDGNLTVSFDVADKAGNAATQLAVETTIDNTAPVVTLGAVIPELIVGDDRWTNDPTPELTGTVTTGGSPITVVVEVDFLGPATASVGDGTWSHQVATSLDDGSHSITITASDEAGNTSGLPASIINIDTTPPNFILQDSPIENESKYDISFSSPVVYAATGATTSVDLQEEAVHNIYKFVTRLSEGAANPIALVSLAADTGVGVANSATTVEYQVYSGSVPPASWHVATVVSFESGQLRTSAVAHLSVAPELATNTSDFTIRLRARDLLGNVSADDGRTRTWHHHPLAPPINVYWQGQITNPSATHYQRSIHRMSMTPTSGQQELAEAMSVGYERDNGRAIGMFTASNPHSVPVRAGFFVPKPAGATYTHVVADVSPWLNEGEGPASAGECGWPDPDVSFRINASGTHTCPPIFWSQPAEDETSPGTVSAALPAEFSTEVRIYGSGGGRVDLVAGGATSIIVDSVTYDFFEFEVPASSTVNVLVMLPSLDLFTPKSGSDTPGTYADVITAPGQMLDGTSGIQISGVEYETWSDCAASKWSSSLGQVVCDYMLKRVQYRGTVSAGLEIPDNLLRLKVRTRAAASAELEEQPMIGDGSAELINTSLIEWATAEPKYPTGANTKETWP